MTPLPPAAATAPHAAVAAPDVAAPRPPAWTLWLGAGALASGGVAVGWLAWVAMHVCYPRIAGERWVLAALAVPAGLAGGAMALCAVGATVRCRHPWHATRWLRWGLFAAALGGLPGLTVGVRWAWVTLRDEDPFAGIWELAWPLALVFAPLAALAPVALALVVRRASARPSHRSLVAARSRSGWAQRPRRGRG